MSFKYNGVIPASKSIMNRALIGFSYSPNLKLLGDSSCDDVLMMKKAVSKIFHLHSSGSTGLNPIEFNTAECNSPEFGSHELNSPEFYCGAAGTTLRFLALRLSRIPGKHILKGTKRLMQRPQKDLLDVLTRLGVEYTLSDETLELTSEGWKNLDQPILVHRGVSSQFASSLILNSWNLDSDLVLQTIGNPISEGYLEMTLEVVKKLGMDITEFSTQDGIAYKIKKQCSIKVTQYLVESDLSSAFAIAAYAAMNGEAIFEQFPSPSLQPDYEFIHFMSEMGIEIQKLMEIEPKLNPSTLVSKTCQVRVKKTISFKGIECNLKSCPDLFPVLAILCAFAKTPSRLYGAPQLIYKESNRIAKISELLEHMNIPHENRVDGMIINPTPVYSNQIPPFDYDTDHDHRLAFAAALVQSQNISINILNPEVVSKSFPEFWDIIKKK